MFVLLFHLNDNYFPGGFIGVNIFFVISGFLITYLCLFEIENSHQLSIKNFYIRRVLRLFPALLSMLIITNVINLYFLDLNFFNYNLTNSFIVLIYITNWFRAFLINSVGLYGHCWSLAIEEQFYLFWPLFISYFLVKLNKIIFFKFLIIVLIIISLISKWYLLVNFISFQRLYNGSDTQMDSLLFGCLSAVIYFENNNFVQKNMFIFKYISYLTVVFYLYILFTISWMDLNLYKYYLLLNSILTSFLILYIINLKENKSYLTSNFLGKIGIISYGLYLWHVPIFHYVDLLNLGSLSVFYKLFFTFTVSFLSFNLIEKRCLNLRRKFRE